MFREEEIEEDAGGRGRKGPRWGVEEIPHGWELVAGVADEHTGLAHRAVPHCDALDELGRVGSHCRRDEDPATR